ncbi:KUP/HAK/KT family potassium transporter [Chitinophaga agrisoli]|uniref:Probable potassium transport system protein Kup n=1 Tax=Chitinophaga agrisoli TaxID=2607653 RepID=A0A5B2VVQ4_9BACT|nr:KUP/HAK/KT family potassium transporter [Chitinophaga agrisoli]KAA2242648.1 KUP/HAK/KT family potassium transporter [Chitinophaga agrisoli]
MNNGSHDHGPDRLKWGGVLLALGIVFGDLGTSPLYTFKAIIGHREISETLVLGGVSAVCWTLFFQTTLKYVFITMRADNNGEGGIFSLYALIRRYGKWILWPAIIGGSFMIADSLITPPISVTSAMEGLRVLSPGVPIMPITIGILVALFLLQQSGTSRIGVFFGPAMVIWFGMIAILGVTNLAGNLYVLKALNPMYAYHLVVDYPGGLWVLGGVFLCTTGAEALYADMGHVGRRNIQVAWIFIKVALLLCYFGEAALLLKHNGQHLTDVDAFYGLVPQWFLIPSIIIATVATVIASQALISGTFTLFNEAIRLNVWPRLRIEFPSDMRGQVYVPAVNWLMMLGCIGMVLHFRESSNMEAAFGLSVTVTMLMTTMLLSIYLYTHRVPKLLVLLLFLVFTWIEVTFLVANLSKFSHGGWLSLLIGFILISTMYIWFAGKRFKRRYRNFVDLKKYIPVLKELSNDTDVPKYATHLVYLTIADTPDKVEDRVIDSILHQQPKRADLYWFVHVEVDDKPYTATYTSKVIAQDEIVHITFKLGFRVVPRINILFKKVIAEMVNRKEIQIQNKYFDAEYGNLLGDFRFVILKSFLSVENNLSLWDNIIMRLHFVLDKLSLPDDKAYGLDFNNVVMEQVPLILGKTENVTLIREK